MGIRWRARARGLRPRTVLVASDQGTAGHYIRARGLDGDRVMVVTTPADAMVLASLHLTRRDEIVFLRQAFRCPVEQELSRVLDRLAEVGMMGHARYRYADVSSA